MKAGLVLVAALMVAAGALYVERDRIGALIEAASASAPQQHSGRGRDGGPKAAPVKTALAVAGSLPVTHSTTGTVVPQFSSTITAQQSGVVATLVAQGGQTLVKGDTIATMDDRSARAMIAKDKAQLDRDNASIEAARLTYTRAQQLLKSQAGTQAASDDAKAALDVTEAALAVDQAQLAADRITLDNTVIRAPFDGKLGAFSVSPGAYVSPGAAIVTLVSLKPVYAEFDLTESELASARAEARKGNLGVTVNPVLGADAGRSETGKADFIDNTVAEASGTFKVRATLANDDQRLWPGQSLRITVHLANVEGLTLVPNVALRPVQDGWAVFVVSGDKAERRSVDVALRDGDTAGLRSGVKPGEQVVIEGMDRLSDGMAVTLSGDTGTKPVGATEAHRKGRTKGGGTKASGSTGAASATQ